MRTQDNKASVPEWFRKWIEFAHGPAIMGALDNAGRLHDELLAYGVPFDKARSAMVEYMKDLPIPLYIRLIVKAALWVYPKLPTWAVRLYWSMVGQD